MKIAPYIYISVLVLYSINLVYCEYDSHCCNARIHLRKVEEEKYINILLCLFVRCLFLHRKVLYVFIVLRAPL